MKRTLPGEIWRVVFGLAAKVRPALILSDYPQDDELALLVVIPHTTAVRGNRWELGVPKAFHTNYHPQIVFPPGADTRKAPMPARLVAD